MIEIIIKDDLAQYIDTEELQRTAEYEVKAQIKYVVTQMIKSDDTVTKIVNGVITKVISETEIGDDVRQLIKKRIFESVENMSNWDIQYNANIDGVVKEICKDNDDEIREIMLNKINAAVADYTVDSYVINNGITDIVAHRIMDQSENIDLKEKLNMFVKNGLERIMESISY